MNDRKYINETKLGVEINPACGDGNQHMFVTLGFVNGVSSIACSNRRIILAFVNNYFCHMTSKNGHDISLSDVSSYSVDNIKPIYPQTFFSNTKHNSLEL